MLTIYGRMQISPSDLCKVSSWNVFSRISYDGIGGPHVRLQCVRLRYSIERVRIQCLRRRPPSKVSEPPFVVLRLHSRKSRGDGAWERSPPPYSFSIVSST